MKKKTNDQNEYESNCGNVRKMNSNSNSNNNNGHIFTHYSTLSYEQVSKGARVKHGKKPSCNPEHSGALIDCRSCSTRMRFVYVVRVYLGGSSFFPFFQKQKQKQKRKSKRWKRSSRKMMSVPFLKLSRQHCEIGIGPKSIFSFPSEIKRRCMSACM